MPKYANLNLMKLVSMVQGPSMCYAMKKALVIHQKQYYFKFSLMYLH